VLTPSKVVHHTVPLRDGVDPWDGTLWEALCASCHASLLTAELRGKLHRPKRLGCDEHGMPLGDHHWNKGG
jgi:hypothetical protein